jgi:CheY-like chemotaxis protein
MQELIIISGKGGTGKTSLVAAFASLAQNIVLCDADVDAADMHLIMNPKIIRILLVSQDKVSMSALKAGLEENQVRTAWSKSGSNAIVKIAEESFDLVVTDENLRDMTGLEFIENVISIKPMVNCAAITSLSSDDFHEASEGLGILMQLPARPGREQAEKLLSKLQTILNLAEQAAADRI